MSVKLTQFSHGAGCGCKIAPDALETILASNLELKDFPHLLVGNDSRDDAAVFDMGNGEALVSTTDFFMPIVDDPTDFGRIAATNAISDIYAMGATPLMAIAILGWPIDKLSPDLAREVLEGGRIACQEAGIPLAGGHSIDNKEPVFGLAVTGKVKKEHLKTNSSAIEGCSLFLTKPLGVGILSTAQKQGKLKEEHNTIARDLMIRPNDIGAELSVLPEIKAMTDVTGFGLLGHLGEICEGSGLSARISIEKVPVLEPVPEYIREGCIPGGTQRNWNSYGHKVTEVSDLDRNILCDPQTSGGLLVATLDPDKKFFDILRQHNIPNTPIGELIPRSEKLIYVD